ASTGPPTVGSATIVLWTANAAAGDVHGDWAQLADPLAAGGTALQNPDRGRAKIAPALGSPANYFEMSFNATAGVAYHLWLRMHAQNDSWSNDSVHVQFSDSVDQNGLAIARIGGNASLEPVQQNGPNGAAPHGWGWTDNGWGALGANVYFTSTGSHVIRIQQR